MKSMARVAAALFLLMMANANADEPGDAGRVAQFKQFLSSRPAVGNLVFSYAGPSGSLSGPFQTNFFHAAWDGDNFFYRQIPSADAYTAKTTRTFGVAGVFCGRYGGKYFYVQNGLIVEGPAGPLPPRPEPIDPITLRALGSLLVLEACLNFGLWDTETNSFVWDGNSFAAKTGNEIDVSRPMYRRLPKAGAKPGPWLPRVRSTDPVLGRIETEGGAVRQMELNSKALTVKYEYLEANPLTPPLPNKTAVFSGKLLRGAFEILRLETSAEPLGDSYFAPDNYVGPGHYRTVRMAKGGLKIENHAEAHEYFTSMKNDPSMKGPREGQGWRLLGIVVFVTAMLGPPLYFLATKSPKQ
jgi:hypothetical protein